MSERLFFVRCITLVVLLLGGASRAGAQTDAPVPGFTPARFWAGSLAAPPRLPLIGAGDDSGRAGLFLVDPSEKGSVDYVRASPLGKPCFPVQAKRDFGKNSLTAVCAAFAEKGKAAILVVPADGSARLLHAFKPDTGVFTQDDLAVTLPGALLPQTPLRATAGDFDGDGRPDALLAGADGRLLLLRNAGGDAVRFTPYPVAGRLPRLRQFAAGDLDGSGRARLVWMDAKGAVFQTAIETGAKGQKRLGRPTFLLRASPDEKLAVGRFRGAKEADLLVGPRLLPGGDPTRALALPELPTAKQARGDLIWLAADLNGDGRDDLVRVRQSGERFIGSDILVHFSGKENTALLDADNDGLPDAWETGLIKPGGLDLPALGCKPGKRDLIVEVQPFADVPQDQLRTQMERVARYFAALPIDNPDGSKGCALHIIYREPMPLEEKTRPWWELGEKYHPAAHRGITHWMEVYNGGGGQSDEMADRGSCGIRALYATFMHEFGHQLGLGHTGGWAPAWCPTYPSVMNYAYNYQRNGHLEEIGYSDGRLASIVLNERHLSEQLPLPLDKVAFLAGPPYHYRLKPTPDGKATLIDWNWNGKFGEKNIAADINYGYSTTGGLRSNIAKTFAAPAPVALNREGKEHLLLFCGRLPDGTAPPPDAAKQPGLCSARPGCLALRLWQGSDPQKDAAQWSQEQTVEADGVTGAPSAARIGEAAWVAYPTTKGVVLRRVTLTAWNVPSVEAGIPIADTSGCEVTLTPFAGGLALLLWRDAKTPVEMLRLQAGKTGATVLSRQKLAFASNAPVGAAEGARENGRPTLWIGLTQDQDAARPSRRQVRCLTLARDGSLSQMRREWIGGEKGGERGSGRIVLLWEPNRAFGSQGQLYFLGCGLWSEQTPWACFYVATRIADTSVNGGWQTRRYYDEWTQSRSAPGVCFFQGDLFFTGRWMGDARGVANDDVFCAFFGRGIETEPMGDFDDIGFIRDVGISHSLPYVAKEP